MDLRSLRHFVAVAETLSFSRAAVRLHRTQPGLSRSIGELEAEFEMQLFERQGRRIALRPAGELLLEEARRLLAQADRLRARARQLAGGHTLVLRLGAAANTLERVLPEVLRLYREDWPQVEVELRSGGGSDLLAALERGELDVAISRITLSDLLVSRYTFPMHVVAVLDRRHRLARRRRLAVTDLAGERLLVPPASFTSRILLDTALRAADIRPHVALESHDINTLVALAEAGLGVAVAPSTVSIAARRVSALAIEHDGHPLGCASGLIWARAREQPQHVARFIDTATAHLRRNFPGKELRLPPLAGAEDWPRGAN